MKRNLRSLITLSMIAGSLVLTSCGDSKKDKKDSSTHDGHEMHQEAEGMDHTKETEKSMVEFKNDTVEQAYKHYLSIKTALVESDHVAVKEAAGKLVDVYGEKARTNEIALRAKRFLDVSNIEEQRDIFSSLTKAMEPVLKEAISSGKIYKQFCPMAFGGRGDYWYSDSEQIRNPYFGDKMLKCGRVEETIM
ncbi:DUF3347 domain-containing protein [Gramella jeungdoensis]|uniref:DUF3347 domain-containing protein n=1 Tax=Gramella jeungdoensis TaxID=708091 RepID=A0ABT0Z5L9_9FLAO|nr:DUF3347 domain-containing protein [Gramella jeungdoensis]MCM8571016.1 DUF3347 domain-containing protein [Gramella jeungdoensis]